MADQVGPDKLRSAAQAFGIDGPELDIPQTVTGSHLGDLPDAAAGPETRSST